MSPELSQVVIESRIAVLSKKIERDKIARSRAKELSKSYDKQVDKLEREISETRTELVMLRKRLK